MNPIIENLRSELIRNADEKVKNNDYYGRNIIYYIERQKNSILKRY